MATLSNLLVAALVPSALAWSTPLWKRDTTYNGSSVASPKSHGSSWSQYQYPGTWNASLPQNVTNGMQKLTSGVIRCG